MSSHNIPFDPGHPRSNRPKETNNHFPPKLIPNRPILSWSITQTLWIRPLKPWYWASPYTIHSMICQTLFKVTKMKSSHLNMIFTSKEITKTPKPSSHQTRQSKPHIFAHNSTQLLTTKHFQTSRQKRNLTRYHSL